MHAVSPEERQRRLDALERHGGNATKAAAELGISPTTLRDFRAREGATAPVPTAPPLPPMDGPIDELIDRLKAETSRRIAHNEAKRWRRFNVPVRGPYALMFFGDPHIDDNGADWTLLHSHCELAASTEALFAVNIGDTTNNWAGRLARLWANQDTSGHTARRLAQWLLAESGVPWWLWLHGNHDGWDGPVGREWFEAKKPHCVTMEDWGAKATLVAPCGHELRVWAAHNFKGSSIWNNLHGLERAAQMGDWAHIYVAGHHHDFGIRVGENADRRFIYNLVRARGYKMVDEHAMIHGFPSYQYGASVLAVVDPDATKANTVQCFADPFEGVDYLQYKRRKAAA